jgi:6 kDa early secretory antigenic target
MTRFQVDSEAVLARAGATNGAIERLRAELSGLHGQLTDLTTVWQGPAASAFQALAGEWRAQAQSMEDSLRAMNQALTHAGTQYAELEQANARLFGR